MSGRNEAENILNKRLGEDFIEVEDNDKEFINKFNLQKILEVLRNNNKYKDILEESDKSVREEFRQKLISFFEYIDVDKTGCINACHLKQILVDTFKILDADEFEGLFFKAEIEGGGFIDYESFVYKIIPDEQGGEPEEENREEEEENDDRRDEYDDF